MKVEDSVPFSSYGSFKKIQDELIKKTHVFVFLGSGIHKIKKKAEQIASEISIKNIDNT
jgi:hypothetical protein